MSALPFLASRTAIPAACAACAVAAGVTLGWTAATGQPLQLLVPFTALLVFGAIHRTALKWQVLLGVLIVVILMIPIRRYTLPSNLPFQLEPYRVIVAGLAMCWIAALLIEPKVRFPKSSLNAPVVLVLLSIVVSIGVNMHFIASTGISDVVVKKVTFFVSFVAVAYLAATVLRTREEVDTAIKALVVCGSIIAVFAVIESRTGHNQFNGLAKFLPFLKLQGSEVLEGGALVERTTRVRAYASAQHPIALGALMVVLLPLGFYLFRTTRRRLWLGATGLLFAGCVGSVSRTPILMLFATGVVLAWFKPREMLRATPFLLVMLVAVHAAIPGALGGIKSAFEPQGGLVQEQKKSAGGPGSGRVADLGPALAQWSRQPVFGQGFGTRITAPDRRANASVLDDQWLASLLEGGALGVAALAWLFVRAVRRLRRAARRQLDDRHGWLVAALAASIAAFATGMFTYDAFSFIQVTVVVFLLIGLTMRVLTWTREPEPETGLQAAPVAEGWGGA